jgi:hypothetical protein
MFGSYKPNLTGRPLGSRVCPTAIRLVFLVLGAIFLVSIKVDATSIVAASASGRVLIAADSKIVHEQGRLPGTACKIIKVGNAFFAVSGFESKFYDLNPWEDAHVASLQRRNVTEIAKAFELRIKPKLIRTLLRMKKEDPDTYKFFKGEPLQGIFAGTENGTPIWETIDFLSTESSRGEILVDSVKMRCPGDCSAINPVNYTFLGHRRAIGEGHDRSPNILEGPPEKVLALLIEIEITGESYAVRPPVSILSIDMDGPRWISPGVCGNQK